MFKLTETTSKLFTCLVRSFSLLLSHCFLTMIESREKAVHLHISMIETVYHFCLKQLLYMMTNIFLSIEQSISLPIFLALRPYNTLTHKCTF